MPSRQKHCAWQAGFGVLLAVCLRGTEEVDFEKGRQMQVGRIRIYEHIDSTWIAAKMRSRAALYVPQAASSIHVHVHGLQTTGHGICVDCAAAGQAPWSVLLGT